MDIRTQAYYQQMRQQQVYRAYVAGIEDTTPPPPPPTPTFYNFTITSKEPNPDSVASLSVTYSGETYDKLFDESTSVLSGSNVSYRILVTDSSKTINTINGESVGWVSEYNSTITVNSDTAISVEFAI